MLRLILLVISIILFDVSLGYVRNGKEKGIMGDLGLPFSLAWAPKISILKWKSPNPGGLKLIRVSLQRVFRELVLLLVLTLMILVSFWVVSTFV